MIALSYKHDVFLFVCLFVCLFSQCGFTPLIRACSTGKRELVKLYLNKGANVNRQAYVCNALHGGLMIGL